MSSWPATSLIVIGVHRRHRRHHQLLLARSTSCPSSPRLVRSRAAAALTLGGVERRRLRRRSSRSMARSPASRGCRWPTAAVPRCPPAGVARYTVGTQRLRVLCRRPAQRIARREPPVGRRKPRAGVDRNGRSAGAQPARHRQPRRAVWSPPTVRGRMLTCNRAAEVITGIPPAASSAGRSPKCCSCPPLRPVLAADWKRRASAGAPSSITARRTGGTIELGLSVTHLETPSGRAGFLVTFQDVTESQEARARATLQQRLAAVGEMAAGIAHEIRNPLASMSGSIQILRQELPLSDEQEQLMDIVLRESERLNATIRSFLAYARPQRFAIARFDVGRLLQRRGAAASQQRRGGATAHVIAVDVPRPSSCVRGRRRADQADRLEPGDQRPPRDAGRRAAALGRERTQPGGRTADVVLTVPRRGDRHSGRGARRPLPAVQRRSFDEGQRPRAGHRPSHRHRLQRRDSRQLAAGRGDHGVRPPAGPTAVRRAEAAWRAARSSMIRC